MFPGCSFLLESQTLAFCKHPEMRFCEGGEGKQSRRTACVFIEKAGAFQVGSGFPPKAPQKYANAKKWKRRLSGVKVHALPRRRQASILKSAA